MRKIFLFLFFLASTFLLKAQDIDLATAKALISKNIAASGLTAADLDNSIITNAYNSGELQLVYLQQAYKGLPVYNVIKTLAFKGGKLVSNAGDRIPEIATKINQVAGTPSISAEEAVKAALSLKKLTAPLQLTKSTLLEGRKYDFGKLGLAYENVTAELLWVPIQDGKQVKLAWQVYLVPKSSSDYWMMRMDASNNSMLEENNLTVYCNWEDPATKNIGGKKYKGILAYNGSALESKTDAKSLFDVTSIKTNEADHAHESPTIVNSASYRVIPLPAESPRHPGGTPVLVNDPWNAAPGNATTLKWHSNGTTDYNITRGNNVWAKEDHAANNSSAGAPATSTTPADPLSFNFVPDFFKQPNQTAPVPNQQFNITNLFYWINTYHDVMYQYGFDEPAGNFQANNQGRGGAGNDFVFGDAQDGNYVAPNQDNANFSTPADGNSGRMQMYLWDTVTTFLVNSPSTIAGNYTSVEGGFSTANKLINIGPVTGQVVYYNDNAAGTTHEACGGAPANSVAGKIAMIDRGNCNFTVKVKNAQTAGAIGVIMVNNVAGYVLMGGTDNTITIPAVNISQADGAILAAQLANNLNVTLAAANLDGDVDNGVIVHEHSHGISNRLTGGPAQASCLSNAEHMGEGWSDYYSLMLTQDWANSNLNTGFSSPRGIGSYVIGQGPTGAGIRTKKYCTDFTVNNLVYGTSIPTVPHDRGEIWCATLWDMTWNIINQVGTINPSIYNATGGGGNTIALKLVTEGMKLQPCSPGFISGRDAILAADQNLYGGLYSCAIKEAFRRRGMGQNASQGSSNNVTDQVTDFAVIASCNCTNVVATTQPVNTSACTGSNATFTVAAGGTTPTYQWQVSTNGGTSYSNIPGATAATLTLNTVTSGMNNNLYQVVITNSCPSTVTSSAALLTVTDPASITTQPANAAVCAGSNTSFTVTAAGPSNTYQWQVSTDGGVTFNNVPGATTATLNLNAVTAALNGNQYHLVITSCGPGAITSNNVTLTVNSPASISAQPTNTNACTGTNTSFSVTAAGTGVTYQWQVSTNGGTSYSAIPGATSATLNLNAVTSGMNNNLYQVVVSSSTCVATVTSSAATLSISDPASISAQPTGVTVCAGSNASFSVTAAGTNITYQWQVSTDGGTNFTDISGQTSATLNLPAVTAALNNNQYRVIVFSCNPTGLNSTAVTLTVNSAASIGTQPTNVSACSGTDASFTVAATGTTLSYQWQVSTNGGTSYSTIPGATSATLSLTGVTAVMNNNLYQVIVTSAACGTPVTSSGGLLTVSNAANISAQPASSTVCAGSNASFTATATGSAFQWQVSTNGGTSFSDIPGANTTTLTLNAVTAAMNNNQYQLVVTSCSATGLTSSVVSLTVNSAPAISANPVDATVCDGGSNTFCVTASGTGLTYQWQVNTGGCGGATWTDIPGATSNCLTISSINISQNNTAYHCVISGTCAPTVTSNCAALTVNAATAITTNPVDVSGCPGTNASFTVAATGAGLGYQWQVSTNGGTSFSNLNGETNSSLNLQNITSGMNSNVYRAVVTSNCSAVGINSDPATLTVLSAAEITLQPVNVSACSNTPASFSVTANGTGLTYQWQVSTDDGASYTDINGETASTLLINEITESMNGNRYRVSIGGTLCNSTSDAAVLTVTSCNDNLLFIFPNPNNGSFNIRFYTANNIIPTRIVTIYDEKGARVYSKAHIVATANQNMEIIMEHPSKGTYFLVLHDKGGNQLAAGKFIIP